MRSFAARRGTAASLNNLSSTLTRLSLAGSQLQQQPLTRPAAAAATRPFSTTPAHNTKTISLQRLPSDPVPAYPYGDRLLYKQSNKGLYGAARIRHGNNISEDNKVKSGRTWRPNIHRKKLWSDSLGAWVRARLSMRVLRTIRRDGGLDAYVLKTKPARLRELGPGGWRLRWLVMQTASVRGAYAEERARLGLPPAPGRPDENEDLVKVVLDTATPGPLSAVSRETLARRAQQVVEMEAAAALQALEMEFALGEEAEVSDEMLAEDLADEMTDEDIDAAIRAAGADKQA